jgi:folate-binding protein YgfZ
MPVVHLTDRAVITVGGPEAEHFLQNIITTDLGTLDTGEARPGALLSPQGKVLFDFLIARNEGDGFLLDCPQAAAEDFVRRLIFYRLRSRLTIHLSDQGLVAVSWGDDSGSSESDSDSSETDSGRLLRDRRFPEAAVWRHYGSTAPTADTEAEEWHRLRITHGVPESGHDYTLGEVFAHDVLLDQLGGIGLRKGCYVGQEVVSRMHHRGTARRRILIATADCGLPDPGTQVTAANRPIGTLGSVAGRQGLALVRIDRVAEAQAEGTPVLAGNVAIDLAIPGWASFTFPEPAAVAGEE